MTQQKRTGRRKVSPRKAKRLIIRTPTASHERTVPAKSPAERAE